MATTIVLVLVNVDCAASPIVLNAITPNAKTCLMISGIFFAIFRVYALIHYFEVKYKEYLNRPDRPEQQKIAQKDPERIMYAYFEVVPGQFIEMFPNIDLPHDVEWYKRTGLNHFSLTVDDIHETLEELKKAGIQVISEPSEGHQRLGNSGLRTQMATILRCNNLRTSLTKELDILIRKKIDFHLSWKSILYFYLLLV